MKRIQTTGTDRAKALRSTRTRQAQAQRFAERMAADEAKRPNAKSHVHNGGNGPTVAGARFAGVSQYSQRIASNVMTQSTAWRIAARQERDRQVDELMRLVAQ